MNWRRFPCAFYRLRIRASLHGKVSSCSWPAIPSGQSGWSKTDTLNRFAQQVSFGWFALMDTLANLRQWR
jgi:hypothetical protein